MMNRNRVKTYRYRIGKKHVLVIKIVQTANAKADSGNVIASNAINMQIAKQLKKMK
ncbi:MAG: hypothetical protein K0Q59_665 [Paenibacillus sp.]|nr:hypothetical protein [Paenibacillus sp.]